MKQKWKQGIVIKENLSTKEFYIWQGVFDSFKEAKKESIGLGFSGEIYRNRTKLVANECISALRNGQPIPSFHKQRSTYLPCTVAMMLQGKTGVRVLDFGGGFGIGYLTLVESMSNDLKYIDYSILEVPEVLEIGSGLLKGKVTYLQEFPFEQSFDLVHAASSLQYIEHWQELIKNFSLVYPKYILLSDVFAGAINNFVSLQNYYGSKIPHWFLNLQDLLDRFDEYGYRLIMKSYATSRRLNIEDNLPMDNFSESLPLPQSLHLLFQAKA